MRHARPSSSALAAALLVTLWVGAGCAGSEPASASAPSTAAPISAPATTLSPAVATEAPTPPAPAATASARPTVTAEPSGYEGQLPPNGILAEGDNGVQGWSGPFCWHGACGALPEIPDKAALPELAIAAGRKLTFSLDEGSFIQWRVGYSNSAHDEPVVLAEGGSAYDPDTAATLPPELTYAIFDPPGAGDWRLVVDVRFVDGDATYGWHLSVV